MISFADQHIVIVGGGSGIGFAAAEKLLSLGARVTIADRDDAVTARLPSLEGEIDYQRCDATSRDEIGAMLGAAERNMGCPDGLFLTVGGSTVVALPDIEPDDWNAQIEFNLSTAFRVGQAALPVLARSKNGSLVLTSSGFALMPGVERIPYVAAKAGVLALTRSFAMAGAPDGVRVNTIAPGPTDTQRFRDLQGAEGVARVRESLPMGHIPTAEECANAALFLLSAASRAITGQTLHVNGGIIMA